MNKHESRILNYSVSWDWKGEPNWAIIQKIVNELYLEGYKPFFYEVDTGSDDYAVLISSQENLTNEAIGVWYNLTLE